MMRFCGLRSLTTGSNGGVSVFWSKAFIVEFRKIRILTFVRFSWAFMRDFLKVSHPGLMVTFPFLSKRIYFGFFKDSDFHLCFYSRRIYFGFFDDLNFDLCFSRNWFILDFSTIQISTCVFLEKDLFCIFRRFKFRVMLFFEKD